MVRLPYPYFYCQFNKTNLVNDPSLFSHIIRVLRYRVSDLIVLYDENVASLVKISKIDNNSFDYTVENSFINEFKQCTLIQGIPDSNKKVDFIVKYGFISGYSTIVFTNTVRSNKINVNLNRLNEIGQNALNLAKICRKVDIKILNINEVDFASFNKVLVCYEGESNLISPITQNNIAIVIGPEGGLDQKDILLFNKYQNVLYSSLGDNIYPTELASIIGYSKLIN
jgi:RsmE family RNA methyltransferase